MTAVPITTNSDHDLILLTALEDTVARLGYKIRNEALQNDDSWVASGACRIGAKHWLIIDQRLSTTQRLLVLRDFLQKQNLIQTYLVPIVRDFIETGPAGNNDNDWSA